MLCNIFYHNTVFIFIFFITGSVWYSKANSSQFRVLSWKLQLGHWVWLWKGRQCHNNDSFLIILALVDLLWVGGDCAYDTPLSPPRTPLPYPPHTSLLNISAAIFFLILRTVYHDVTTKPSCHQWNHHQKVDSPPTNNSEIIVTVEYLGLLC